MNRRGYDGRFIGADRRNVESSPRLPAWLVGRIWDHANGQTIRLVWRNYWDQTIVMHASREDGFAYPGVWIHWPQTSAGMIFQPRRVPIRNRGFKVLVDCPGRCGRAVRHLYSEGSCRWVCRVCAGLRYASEGRRVRMNRFFGPLPRLWTWGDPQPSVLPRADGKG
jgi:hypothetical protein